MTKQSPSSIAAIKRNRAAKLASLATKAYYLHRRGQDEKMYSLICDEFISLGGIYIKFLQGVLLQSQSIKFWDNPDRLKVFENLDHEPIDIVATLKGELSPSKLAKIKLIQPQPFAAGSFGQVYYGQHANGKPIIIKVLRPMVRELLKFDLRMLSIFTKRLVEKQSANLSVDMDQAIKDFRSATLKETDYISEVQFASEYYEHFKGNPQFIVPETYVDLCTANIIVQEYIDGVSVAQLIRLKEQGADPRAYVRDNLGSDLDTQLQILGVESINAIFNMQRVQGDPHPGNVRLLSGNRVGMIDFGIAAPTPDNKAAFYGILSAWNQIYGPSFEISSLFEQFIRFFVSDLYRALQRLATINPARSNDSNSYTREIGKMAEATFKKSVGVQDLRPFVEDGSILGVLNKVINKNNRFGLVLKLEASEILRASQTYMTLVESLGRRNQVLPKVFKSVVETVEREHPEFTGPDEASLSVSDSIDIVSKWLERIAVRDPAFFHQIISRIKIGSVKLMPKSSSSNEDTMTIPTIRKEKTHA
ncbi:MAG TPA: AarF/ABC1/UbiB kinase family protein [Candidatus Saccharimonadales bacterium]|nr:AarF/ABC1/UbiB kinase family protein [Candidatus Saccharimonadales bacterium]